MIGLLCFVLTVLAAPFKSKIRLEAEASRCADIHLDLPSRRCRAGSAGFFRSPYMITDLLDDSVLALLRRKIAPGETNPELMQG
jgi:hypothetical protein